MTNAEIAEKIYDYIKENHNSVCNNTIIKEFNLSSPQKAAAIMKLLVDTNRVTKAMNGKFTVYFIAKHNV